MPVIERANVIAGAQFRAGAPATGQGPAVSSPVTCVVIWDFAVHGGAVGGILLLGTQGLGLVPNNSLVTSFRVNVLTIPVGAGASIGVGVNAANDLQAAAAITGAPWSTLGDKVVALAAPIRLTAARDVTMNVSGAPLTAGRIQFLIDYIPGS